MDGLLQEEVDIMRSVDLTGCSLVLMVTMGCYSECAHCCLSSSRAKLGSRLTKEEMELYIKEASEVNVQSVVFTGGEPTAYLDDLYEPMSLARDLGLYVDLRTNGYWAENQEKAQAILQHLHDCGLRRLGLSFDKFHAEFISDACIKNIIEAAQILGMDIYLDWIGNESREYVARHLGIADHLVRMVGPPLKVGRARQITNGHFALIPIEDVECHSEFSYVCGDDGLSLTIFPNDYVSLHSCCWVNPGLIRRRSPNDDWLAELVEDVSQDPITNLLYRSGIGGLIRIARRENPRILKDYYSHQCEACFDILKEIAVD